MNELQEFAKRLSGEWTAFDDIIDSAEKEAKKKGIVIVYGESDDLCELRGAIYDEFGCWDGGTAYITKDGQITKNKNGDVCKRISALWCSNDDGWCWTYDVDFPHEVFELYDHGEKYCRGLVFYLKDIRTEILEQEEISNEELKEAIVYIATTRTFTDSFGEEMGIDIEVAKEFADALIAAGLKFDTVISHTATFDLAQQEYINSLERRVAELEESDASKEQSSINYYCEMREWKDKCKEAEHRAEVAEKALDLCETAYILPLNHRATEGISGQAIASDLGVHKFFMEQAEKKLAEEGKSENN